VLVKERYGAAAETESPSGPASNAEQSVCCRLPREGNRGCETLDDRYLCVDNAYIAYANERRLRLESSLRY